MKNILLIFILILVIQGCTDDEEVIFSPEITFISPFITPEQIDDWFEVKCNIIIEDATSVEVLTSGIILSKESNPTIEADNVIISIDSSNVNRKISAGTTIETRAENLDLNSIYFVKVFVKLGNNEVLYGQEFSITTSKGDFWVELNYPEQYKYLDRPIRVAHEGKYFYGIGMDDGVNRSWHSYNTQSGIWTELSSYPGTGGFDGTAFVINDKIYVTAFSHSKETWEYDTELDLWTQKSDLPVMEYGGFFSFSYNNEGYVGGGYGNNQVWKFNPSDESNGSDVRGNPLGKWHQLADHPNFEFSRSQGFAMGNKKYVLSKSRIFEYDIEGDDWSLITISPFNFGLPFGIDNTIYIVGENDVRTYNLDSSEWSTLGSSPYSNYVRLVYADAFIIGGAVYIGDFASFYRYIPLVE
ncbi:hypothetical protein SAMN05421640_1022 [Ekhidna lutea]|uniref:Kelch motif-containing protein n=1 Tax=Ekhidna lutea TaxID=447679 RepID=A0A239GV96_EKHLU|nr:hypothetical protein [Ekhidna lutea]SNS73037.1 hypothetical protein SAMN05421640_1022 [Ekhidna lutea]